MSAWCILKEHHALKPHTQDILNFLAFPVMYFTRTYVARAMHSELPGTSTVHAQASMPHLPLTGGDVGLVDTLEAPL